MTPAQRPVTRKNVLTFEDHCVRSRAFWVHYQTLFEGSDLRRELLETTSKTFFRDLKLMLVEHLILQICKLTDPEFAMGKTRRNLTVAFLMANADFSASPHKLSKLKSLAARMDTFRKQLLPARNKLISHLDLDAAHGRQSLGGASMAAWRAFWLDLQDFITIMHERYVDAHQFYLNGVGGLSDADEFVKAIKEGTYFSALLDDGTLTVKVDDVARHSKYYEA